VGLRIRIPSVNIVSADFGLFNLGLLLSALLFLLSLSYLFPSFVLFFFLFSILFPPSLFFSSASLSLEVESLKSS